MIATNQKSDEIVPLIKFYDDKLQVLHRVFYNNETAVGQHLYIINDNKIEENDYFMSAFLSYPLQNKKGGYATYPSDLSDFKKIIASTDPKLNLPAPSKAFIQKYCEKSGIDKVMVEYKKAEIWGNNGSMEPIIYVPKLSSDNTITIKSVKPTTKKEGLERLKDLLIKYDLRKHLNINDFGYSQIERDIVDLFM